MFGIVYSSLAATEKFLNAAGYVPGLNVYSGAARVAFGQYEVIGFAAFGALHYLRASITHDPNHLKDAKVALLNTSHDFANIFRGAVEVVPLAGFGLAAYDFNGFRVTYDHEGEVFEKAR